MVVTNQAKTGLDLYEIEIKLRHNNDRKIMAAVKHYGRIKEEIYTWGEDQYHRERREKLILRVVVNREKLPYLKMRLGKIDPHNVTYRKIMALV